MILRPANSRLHAQTAAIADPGDLTEFLTPESIAFIHGRDGLVGIGELTRYHTDSLDAADVWWQEFNSTIEHESELPGFTGTGPLAFGSFAFDPDHSGDPSVLVVPEVIIGRRGDLSWITRLGHDRVNTDLPERQPPPDAPTGVRLVGHPQDAGMFSATVAALVRLIEAHDAQKVVLARRLMAVADEPIDPRWLVRTLASHYTDCWAYLIDGLVGATPELLVSTDRGLAVSRVLAGTTAAPRDRGSEAAAWLDLTSAKNLSEHVFARESVVEQLRGFCTTVHTPPAPYVLRLPNVLHLATDITGILSEGTSALAIAAALHPSAAVCGTPRHVALDLINELEGIDRGRYAGPVGWVDSQGEGEWAIALRCGQISPAAPNMISMFAGAGIVAESEPDAELAESTAKFAPMLDALGLTEH